MGVACEGGAYEGRSLIENSAGSFASRVTYILYYVKLMIT